MTTPTTDTAGLVERLRRQASVERTLVGTNHNTTILDEAADLITRLTSPVEGLEGLGEIEARANAATPGPWCFTVGNSRGRVNYQDRKGEYDHRICDSSMWVHGETSPSIGGPTHEQCEANTAFIAHARTDIPRLLQIIRTQSATIASLQEERMADVETIDCPQCGGAGCVEGIEPACCGNLTKSGDCRGSCAVPQQCQEQCSYCGGSGTVEVDSSSPTSHTGRRMG